MCNTIFGKKYRVVNDTIYRTIHLLLNLSFKENRVKIDSKNETLIKKVVKSIIITIPIVLVIIMLLSSADSIFGDIFINALEKIIISFSKIKMSTVVIKVILIILAYIYIYIYMLCLFDYIVSRYKKDEGIADTSFQIKDDFTIKMILTALNIVYLIFCYIQIKSLFLRSVEIDYAQYARQGFFQLMIVSFINLVTILIAKKVKNLIEKTVI